MTEITDEWYNHQIAIVNKRNMELESALREKDAEIVELKRQLSVACNFHGEDLVPALIADNSKWKALAENLQGVQGESGSIVFNVGEERK